MRDSLQIKTLEQHMSTCQNSAAKCTALINECGNRQRQAHNLTTFRELDRETEWKTSSNHMMHDFTINCLNVVLPSESPAYFGMYQTVFASHTHQDQERYKS